MSTAPDTVETLIAAPLRLDVRWKGDRIASLRLAWAQPGDAQNVSTPLGRELALALARYVAGEPAAWPELPVDLDALPPFHRVVLEELFRIPAGSTMSYGGLAARCGRPGSARAVGQAMARNPWPLVYPCHRVLASDGGLHGFQPGLEMKRWLLEKEGAL